MTLSDIIEIQRAYKALYNKPLGNFTYKQLCDAMIPYRDKIEKFSLLQETSLLWKKLTNF